MKTGDVIEFIRSGTVMWRGTVLNGKQVKLHKKYRTSDGVCKIEMHGLHVKRMILGISIFEKIGPPLLHADKRGGEK